MWSGGRVDADADVVGSFLREGCCCSSVEGFVGGGMMMECLRLSSDWKR